MRRAKNINMFLMDGVSSGRIKCTLSNWNGLVYKIPRTQIDECKDIEFLKQTGIYLLFGIDEETGKDLVYVGQASVRSNNEGTLYRIKEHKKTYWTEAIILTTSDNTLGRTEISYLENKLHNLAVDANRYVIDNGNNPNVGNVTEEKEADLLEFIDNIKMIIGTLGYKLFDSISSSTNINEKNSGMILYLTRKSSKSNQQIEAKAKLTNEGIVVLSGSMIEQIDSERIPASLVRRRIDAKIENGILLEDELFKSPSYAASFVIGGHINGLAYWKNKEGISLKELQL